MNQKKSKKSKPQAVGSRPGAQAGKVFSRPGPIADKPAPRRPEPTEVQKQSFERPDGPARPWPPSPPELLAPAGSKAAWAAAMDAGADAIYLGLNDFSARTYADNFSLPELKAVIDESRRAGVRIYLALNSLIKEDELEKAFKLLAAAASFEPDAFILQDLGLAALARRHFPHIERHASTLTATHSLPALIMLKKAGFSRAVLARELALDEIAALAAHSPIDVEVFIHGALCFSFSGLCLMSSFLGGRSALRGGCTQPCRRVYARGGKKSALFSTADLAAAPYINELRRLPIASFKIEGRMKGPDYVDRVVRAYRMLLDAPDRDWPYALAEAENILAEAPGRGQTCAPLVAAGPGALAPLASAASGLKVGFLEPVESGRGRVKLARAIEVQDRVRLQPRAGEESPAFNIKEILLDGLSVPAASAGSAVELLSSKMPALEGMLFKISSGREEKAFMASALVKAVKASAAGAALPPPRKLPAEASPWPKRSGGAIEVRRLPLWVWLEKAEDMPDVAVLEPKKIILPLTAPNVRHIRRNRRRLKNEWPRLVFSLPPLIFYRRQAVLNKEISGLISFGFRDFMVSNLGQINMAQRAGREVADLKIWGDHRLGFLNHLSEAALAELGLAGIAFSLEADEEAFKRLWKTPPPAQRLIYFYGRPALFTSRFPLDGRKTPIVSPKGEKFRLALEGEETVIMSDRPVFMAPLLKMPPLPGGEGLIIDLRFEPGIAEKARELKKAVGDAGRGQGSIFNFKRGLI